MSRVGLYDEMVEHSPNLWIIHEDGLVTAGRTRPTRDELVEAFMSIPEYTMHRKTNGDPGYHVVSGPTYRNRQDAERAVTAYCLPEEKAA